MIAPAKLSTRRPEAKLFAWLIVGVGPWLIGVERSKTLSPLIGDPFVQERAPAYEKSAELFNRLYEDDPA